MHLLCRLFAILLVVATSSLHAQGVIFRSGLEAPTIDPLYPLRNGEFVLPDGPATAELDWLLSQLVPGASPADEEIQQHFTSTWLATNDVQATRDFLLAVQSDYPDARVTDVVGITPMQFTGLITGSNGNEAFVVLTTTFAGGQINQLGVNFFGTGAGSVIFGADAALDLDQAADRFATLSEEPGLLVARIVEGQCVPVVARGALDLRATASIFKIWVLGGVGDAIGHGVITTGQLVPRTDDERVPGGPIINEPDGTLFTVAELATLMMGISDNTATDLLHELVGRDAIDRIVASFGHATPDVLTPLLGVSETFHLLFSFPLSEAQGYVNGNEMAQMQFVEEELEPLGSFADTGGGFNNVSLMTTGTWLASPTDVCQALAAHRTWPNGSDQAILVDRALGAQAAQPNVRERWDRVWYKGGSLSGDVGNDGSFENVVLTHAWLLENTGQPPWVVVAMSNDPDTDIDDFAVQSITGRILQLVSEMP